VTPEESENFAKQLAEQLEKLWRERGTSWAARIDDIDDRVQKQQSRLSFAYSLLEKNTDRILNMVQALQTSAKAQERLTPALTDVKEALLEARQSLEKLSHDLDERERSWQFENSKAKETMLKESAQVREALLKESSIIREALTKLGVTAERKSEEAIRETIREVTGQHKVFTPVQTHPSLSDDQDEPSGTHRKRGGIIRQIIGEVGGSLREWGKLSPLSQLMLVLLVCAVIATVWYVRADLERAPMREGHSPRKESSSPSPAEH
jgi:hypothetical protein